MATDYDGPIIKSVVGWDDDHGTPGQDAFGKLHGSLWTALDNGLTTGRAVALDGDVWRAWAWQEIGPKWIAIAEGAGPTDEDARTLAEERLADEVAKQADKRPPGDQPPDR